MVWVRWAMREMKSNGVLGDEDEKPVDGIRVWNPLVKKEPGSYLNYAIAIWTKCYYYTTYKKA